MLPCREICIPGVRFHPLFCAENQCVHCVRNLRFERNSFGREVFCVLVRYFFAFVMPFAWFALHVSAGRSELAPRLSAHVPPLVVLLGMISAL